MEKLKRSVILEMFLSYNTPGEMTQFSLFFSSGLRRNEVSGSRASGCSSFPELSKVFIYLFITVGAFECVSFFLYSSVQQKAVLEFWDALSFLLYVLKPVDVKAEN